jgi:DNA-binding IclR family transcriptional regulator
VTTPRRTQPASQSATANGATGSAVQASRAAPTAARALRVVELLATEPTRAWKLAEIQRELGYSHGNLHAIVATLVAMGYLRRDDDSRTYTLGPALLGIGAAAREAYPSVELALPHLERLAAELGTEAHAAARVGQAVLVVARCGPDLPPGGGVHVGERLPLTPPIGSTLMAWATEPEVEEYLATGEGALSADELATVRETLGAVRRRGYSVHVYAGSSRALGEAAARVVKDGLAHPEDQLADLVHELARQDYLPSDASTVQVGEGVQLSAPVFGPDGTVELSIGVAFVGPDIDLTSVMAAPELLVGTAATLTATIGGRPPQDPSTA